MKSKLTRAEVCALVDAQLMTKITADNLKAVKDKVKTDELETTVVGQDSKGNVHEPYRVDGIGEIQVIDSERVNLDKKMLESIVGKEVIERCSKVSTVHTVNIKADDEYAVNFKKRLEEGLALLDAIDSMKEEVRAKVRAMINKAQAN